MEAAKEYEVPWRNLDSIFLLSYISIQFCLKEPLFHIIGSFIAFFRILNRSGAITL